ncbi:cell division protein FtsL [Marinicellulosiphila megalodicopiae]|uniref:cell division protein FtsL n=1 Tax=Marinicellulosiphila megalodicopiae TaxID=2724896 RepID=UPI003BAF84E6
MFTHKLIAVVVLTALVLMSAILVIKATHSTRNAFASLQVLKKEYREELVIQTQYLLEKSTLLSPSLLENLAIEKFKMQVPTKQQIHMIETIE